MEWLQTNWLPLLIVIIFIIGTIIYLIKSKGLRKAAVDAIVWAENACKTEEGKVKMQEAIDYIQQLVPLLNLVPDALIHSFIQSVFDQIKVALDNDPNQKIKIDEEIIEEAKVLEEKINNTESEG